MGEVTSGVTEASLIMLEVGIGESIVSFDTTEPNADGVSETKIPGTCGAVTVSEMKISGVDETKDVVPPDGVGVVYCPQRDVLPAHETVAKDKTIKMPKIRFTIHPFGELYLFIQW